MKIPKLKLGLWFFIFLAGGWGLSVFATNNTKDELKTAHTTDSLQLKLPIREYLSEEFEPQMATLNKSHGNNKILPPGYELQALLALSHFPQLKDIKIEFIVKDVGIPISSRPRWTSLLRSAKKRTYIVVIDTDRKGNFERLLLKTQPFNAQVGIIGHELAHTIYYLDRSFFAVTKDALCQLSKCRNEFERATDRRLIDYGLGWQRYDHAKFLHGLDDSIRATNEPPPTSTGPYMTPAELLHLLKKDNRYLTTQY